MKKRTDHWVCWGCTREGVVYSAAGHICPVWADQTKITMVRQGECFFNRKVVETKKVKGRVGQQKTKRIRG